MSLGKENEFAADHPKTGLGEAKRVMWDKRSALHEPLEKLVKLSKGAAAAIRADGNLRESALVARQSFLHLRES